MQCSIRFHMQCMHVHGMHMQCSQCMWIHCMHTHCTCICNAVSACTCSAMQCMHMPGQFILMLIPIMDCLFPVSNPFTHSPVDEVWSFDCVLKLFCYVTLQFKCDKLGWEVNQRIKDSKISIGTSAAKIFIGTIASKISIGTSASKISIGNSASKISIGTSTAKIAYSLEPVHQSERHWNQSISEQNLEPLKSKISIGSRYHRL